MDNQFARKHAAAFGKPSLKRRLEEYYKIVSPDIIADETDWRTRFEQIWSKFGGTLAGETKLAVKLEKKYGAKLEVAYHLTPKSSEPSNSPNNEQRRRRDEASFELTKDERDSGVCHFMSSRFDPFEALRNQSKTKTSNASILKHASMLDRVDQFASLLPTSDPLYRPAPRVTHAEDAGVPQSKVRAPSYLAKMAGRYKDRGPMQLLFKAAFGKRRKLCITTRYSSGIRGTLVGNLVGFDKHMNLLLKDAKETYCQRQKHEPDQSNMETEKARRAKLSTDSFVRHRTVRNIMVRGDTVVSCYFADATRPSVPARRQRQP